MNNKFLFDDSDREDSDEEISNEENSDEVLMKKIK